MATKLTRYDLGFGGAALVAAYAVKAHAATASAEELAFVLKPTASGVELLTGHAFVLEKGAGYVSRELGLAIAPACSGTNFLVIAFATLVFGFLWRCRTAAGKIAWFSASAGLGWLATVAVNTLSISLSVAERSLVSERWLSAQALHRATGVAVYLGCLLALYGAVDRAFGGRRAGWSFAVPLFFYVAVTLLVPQLRGAELRPESVTHALVVLFAAALCALILRPKSRPVRP
jgi:exosortase K